MAGRRILAPIIKVRVLVAQPTVMSPSSSRPRTAAFHAVNRGSNPLGDTKEIQGLRVKSKSFFRMWGIVAPHSAPQISKSFINLCAAG